MILSAQNRGVERLGRRIARGRVGRIQLGEAVFEFSEEDRIAMTAFVGGVELVEVALYGRLLLRRRSGECWSGHIHIHRHAAGKTFHGEASAGGVGMEFERLKWIRIRG